MVFSLYKLKLGRELNREGVKPIRVWRCALSDSRQFDFCKSARKVCRDSVVRQKEKQGHYRTREREGYRSGAVAHGGARQRGEAERRCVWLRAGALVIGGRQHSAPKWHGGRGCHVSGPEKDDANRRMMATAGGFGRLCWRGSWGLGSLPPFS
ncbi:hypothetical protein U1Q18_039284 [Sarracenia purpurea var. burkii]